MEAGPCGPPAALSAVLDHDHGIFCRRLDPGEPCSRVECTAITNLLLSAARWFRGCRSRPHFGGAGAEKAGCGLPAVIIGPRSAQTYHFQGRSVPMAGGKN